MFKYTILFICLSVCAIGYCQEDKNEGDACEWDSIKGTCVNPRRCLTTLDNRSPKQPICGNDGDVSLICCTDCQLVNDTSNVIIQPTGNGLLWKNGRKARDQCIQYLKELPNNCPGYYGGMTRTLDEEERCHRYAFWAVGGPPAIGAEPPSEHPYEALMGFGEDLQSAVWTSSGAIISDSFILTTAHGLSDVKYVAVGVRDRTTDTKDWQTHTVKKIHFHPKWNCGTTRYNDIALVELNSKITFNGDIHPACLPTPSEHVNIKKGKISSWKTDEMDSDTFTDTASTVELTKLTATECSDLINENEDSATSFSELLPRGINATTQVCYGTKDTCLQTNGSPVVVNTQFSRCIDTVVGLESFSDVCGPAVFTKISYFVRWIESVVWP